MLGHEGLDLVDGPGEGAAVDSEELGEQVSGAEFAQVEHGGQDSVGGGQLGLSPFAIDQKKALRVGMRCWAQRAAGASPEAASGELDATSQVGNSPCHERSRSAVGRRYDPTSMGQLARLGRQDMASKP